MVGINCGVGVKEIYTVWLTIPGIGVFRMEVSNKSEAESTENDLKEYLSYFKGLLK